MKSDKYVGLERGLGGGFKGEKDKYVCTKCRELLPKKYFSHYNLYGAKYRRCVFCIASKSDNFSNRTTEGRTGFRVSKSMMDKVTGYIKTLRLV